MIVCFNDGINSVNNNKPKMMIVNIYLVLLVLFHLS